MIYLNLTYDDASLKKPIELLRKKLKFEISDSGFTVNAYKADCKSPVSSI